MAIRAVGTIFAVVCDMNFWVVVFLLGESSAPAPKGVVSDPAAVAGDLVRMVGPRDGAPMKPQPRPLTVPCRTTSCGLWPPTSGCVRERPLQDLPPGTPGRREGSGDPRISNSMTPDSTCITRRNRHDHHPS
jgi:hypothetical protein